MRAADPEGRTAKYVDAWDQLLSGPREELVGTMLSTDQNARDLRQSSPFGGVLTDEERLDAIRRVAAGEASP
jgi:hypothetical protein